MSFVTVLLIALSLAMDAFAVCLGAGATRFIRGPRPCFRLSFHFGLFQALMPIAGWLIGTRVAPIVERWDHWVAFALLGFVGVRLIRASLDAAGESHAADPSRGGTLVMLSVATSIDAFAVGLSLAMLDVEVLLPALVIGIVAAALSLVGLMLGRRLGRAFGRRMELIGGLTLIGIGIRVLISHLA